MPYFHCNQTLPSIAPGMAVVNDAARQLRLILQVDGQTVTYRAFRLYTGEAYPGIDQCSLVHLRRWANRQATTREVERLSVERPAADRPSLQSLLVNLSQAPDTLLLAECRRRGLLPINEDPAPIHRDDAPRYSGIIGLK